MANFKKFKQDEAVGRVAENFVLRLLNGCGLNTVPVSIDNRKYWDIEADIPNGWYIENNKIKIEVKHDVYQATTGNLAIEVWNTRKNEPAGINLTKADLWAHVLSDSIWLCRAGDLRNFTLAIEPKRKINAAGDGNALIYLYESDQILQAIFHRVDKMTIKELKSKIEELCKVQY